MNTTQRWVRRGLSLQPLLTVVVIVGGLVIPITVSAQRTDSLTLSSVYQSVDRGTPRIAAARAAARAEVARVGSARRLPDPRLQFGLMNRVLPGFDLDPVLGMNQFQLTQMIPTPGKLGLSVDVARARADAATLRSSDVQWAERSRAAMAFYELYQVDRTLDVTHKTQDILRDIVSTTETMYATGEGRQADVLRAQVELARMSEDLIVMQAMRVSAAARLNSILNRPGGSAVPGPVLPRFPDSLPSLDDLVAIALVNRPMLLAQASDIRAALSAERLARREIWPDLEAGIQYGWQPMTGGTIHMLSLMVGISLPIWAGSRQLAMRDEARAMREMAEAELGAMESDTRARIAELVATSDRARSLSQLYQNTVIPQSEAMVTSTQTAYRAGSVNFMTLLDAAMSVNRYRQELFRMEAERGQALADLEMMTGRGLMNPDPVSSIGNPGGRP
ncbi:MAG: TolC family protein [Gemmatimonadota bacterium]